MLFYDLMEGVTDEEEKILFVAKSNLFTLGTITLTELKILSITIIDAEANTFNFPHFEGEIPIDVLPALFIVQELNIAC